MRIRPSIFTAAVLAAAAVAPVRAQVGLAVVDNGHASRAAFEQGFCPPASPNCLAGRVFYWSCSGSTCTNVTTPTFSTHAGQVAAAAARQVRNYQTATDAPVAFYSIVGNPEPFLWNADTPVRVVVNTLGVGVKPPACGTGTPPPPWITVVRATGNQEHNGFVSGTPLHPPPSTVYDQGQIDCRPGVTSVAGTLAMPDLEAGLSVWVGDRNGNECLYLGDDNNPCSQYPFFVKSNFTPLTTFAAEGCLSTILSSTPCTSGSLVGTSFSAAVVGGVYAALYRQNESLTPSQAESLLAAATPDTFFKVHTLGSPLNNGQQFPVKILTPLAIQGVLDSQ